MQNISKNKKNSVFEVFFLPFEKNVVFLQPQNGGTVAQLVEQRTENPRVTGSIPVGTTKNLETQIKDSTKSMIASLFCFVYITSS